MTDIYAASESPIDGVTGKHLLDEIRLHGQRHTLYVPDVAQVAAEIRPLLQQGDLVLSLGAGNIVKAGETLVTMLTNN